MNTISINSPEFHQQLFKIDHATARATQKNGCQYCKGTLHIANYPRIGFGVPANQAPYYSLRFSFCCADCRRRHTPASIRFFGRLRYVATIFILLSALRFSPSELRCIRLANKFDVFTSLATWKRWITWWRVDFPLTRQWIDLKAHFPSSTSSIPRALLKQLTYSTLATRLQQTLMLLSLPPKNVP